ncbi:helix-turn-helix domain-containing protein [Bifidobacterium saguinibicoloris]|uniref:helix-turn-helix domain-containing protein n=1 Tax=Bifidobacterium saguinibicoloris TaxID=2834433 RepID=UPI001C588061|nr:helix-turn-helix transcriptional regulator [Bifidobacterium saguinibicoloris]MBW3080517.1 helix-turn-helix transcriptional regulator [Bifidobacterium saguinibicoloris]
MTQTTDTPVSTFGQRLQRCRKSQKIGAEKLAEMVNAEYGEGTTTRSVITAIETGRKLEGVTMAEVLRFAHMLHVSPLCLIIDLEQPFLRADFPGFDGLCNYQAMRRMTGGVVFDRFTESYPEYMRKGQRIGLALDDAVRSRASVISSLKELEETESGKRQVDYVAESREIGLSAAELAAIEEQEQWETRQSMCVSLGGFVEQRQILIDEGVIIPDAKSGLAARFTESAVTLLQNKVAPYKVTVPRFDSEDMWGDAL